MRIFVRNIIIQHVNANDSDYIARLKSGEFVIEGQVMNSTSILSIIESNGDCKEDVCIL